MWGAPSDWPPRWVVSPHHLITEHAILGRLGKGLSCSVSMGKCFPSSSFLNGIQGKNTTKNYTNVNQQTRTPFHMCHWWWCEYASSYLQACIGSDLLDRALSSVLWDVQTHSHGTALMNFTIDKDILSLQDTQPLHVASGNCDKHPTGAVDHSGL